MSKALEIYNELFAKGELNFVDFDINELPKATTSYFKMFITEHGWSAKLHKPVIDGEYLFQINHPKVRYLAHDSENAGHIWADENFDNLDNNEALIELSGLKGQNAKMMKKMFDDIDGQEQ